MSEGKQEAFFLKFNITWPGTEFSRLACKKQVDVKGTSAEAEVEHVS